MNISQTFTCAAEFLCVLFRHVQLGGQDVVVFVPRVRVHLLAVMIKRNMVVLKINSTEWDKNEIV